GAGASSDDANGLWGADLMNAECRDTGHLRRVQRVQSEIEVGGKRPPLLSGFGCRTRAPRPLGYPHRFGMNVEREHHCVLARHVERGKVDARDGSLEKFPDLRDLTLSVALDDLPIPTSEARRQCGGNPV